MSVRRPRRSRAKLRSTFARACTKARESSLAGQMRQRCALPLSAASSSELIKPLVQGWAETRSTLARAESFSGALPALTRAQGLERGATGGGGGGGGDAATLALAFSTEAVEPILRDANWRARSASFS